MRKPVERCLQSIARMRTALGSARQALAHRLAARARALAAGKPAEDPLYGPVFDHLDAELAAAHRHLADAEHAYEAAQHDLAQLRRERDDLAARLHDLAAAISKLFVNYPGLRRQAPGPPPQSPSPLARHLTRTLAFLSQLERVPPPPVPGVHIDPGILAVDLQSGLRRLESSFSAVTDAQARTNLAHERADQTHAFVRRIVPWVGHTLENLTRLAGEESVVGKIRSSGA